MTGQSTTAVIAVTFLDRERARRVPFTLPELPPTPRIEKRMPALASDPYVLSLEEVFWGGLLVAITMTIHGFGMPLVLRTQWALADFFEKRPSFAKGIALLILASWLILLVHLIEVLVWAAFFLWKGALPTASLAYYFSLNEYTTVGSAYSLPRNWRLLEGMIAIAGLLTFAWSTGILFTLAQDFQEQQMQHLKERRERRKAARAASERK